jgi:hypothetical protein
MTGTIAGFTSTGIDDNATSTAITIDANERLLINTTVAAADVTMESTSAGGHGAALSLTNQATTSGSGVTLSHRGKNAGGSQKDYAYIRMTATDTATGSEDGAIDFQVVSAGAGPSQKVRVDTDGLKFNGDTAAANALDDYEEGTWDLALTAATSGTITYNAVIKKGAYTKIGRHVHCQGRVAVSAVSSPVGDLRIALPFTSADLAEHSDYGIGSVLVEGIPNAGTNLALQLTAGKAYLILVESSAAGVLSVIDASVVQVYDEVRFSFSYIAA